jgi:hypothetical protein
MQVVPGWGTDPPLDRGSIGRSPAMAHLPTPPRPWLEETDPPPPFVFGRGKGVRFENDLRALASRVERATFHFKTRLSDFWHQRRLTFAILIFYKLRLILRFTAWQITCRWGMTALADNLFRLCAAAWGYTASLISIRVGGGSFSPRKRYHANNGSSAFEPSWTQASAASRA